MTQNMRHGALFMRHGALKNEVENVLILPSLFLRERITSLTSAEDIGE